MAFSEVAVCPFEVHFSSFENTGLTTADTMKQNEEYLNHVTINMNVYM
jgi:hypothetical protein